MSSVRTEARIDEALDLLRKGKTSVGRAAELAGVTLYEMVDLVRQHGIPSGYSLDEMSRDTKRAEKWLKRRRARR